MNLVQLKDKKQVKELFDDNSFYFIVDKLNVNDLDQTATTLDKQFGFDGTFQVIKNQDIKRLLNNYTNINGDIVFIKTSAINKLDEFKKNWENTFETLINDYDCYLDMTHKVDEYIDVSINGKNVYNHIKQKYYSKDDLIFDLISWFAKVDAIDYEDAKEISSTDELIDKAYDEIVGLLDKGPLELSNLINYYCNLYKQDVDLVEEGKKLIQYLNKEFILK